MTRPAMVVKRDRTEQWADRITVQLSKTVESILEVGRLLVKAKADLPHGEFGRLFDDQLVPFGSRTAARLMAIAQHPILSNETHASTLPSSWMTLYQLSQADRTKLKAALKDGLITPDLKRRDLQALLPAEPTRRRTTRSRGAVPVTGRTPGSRLYFQIAQLLSDEFDGLSLDDQDDFLGLIDQALADLRGRRSDKDSQ